MSQWEEDSIVERDEAYARTVREAGQRARAGKLSAADYGGIVARAKRDAIRRYRQARHAENMQAANIAMQALGYAPIARYQRRTA